MKKTTRRLLSRAARKCIHQAAAGFEPPTPMWRLGAIAGFAASNFSNVLHFRRPIGDAALMKIEKALRLAPGSLIALQGGAAAQVATISAQAGSSL